MAAAEVRWKYDEFCGTIEVVGHGELFPCSFYGDGGFSGPIEDVGPASVASLRRALVRYMQCVPARQRRLLPPPWEIEVVVGDAEDPDFVDSHEWVFLEPVHLIFQHDGLRVAQDYAIKNNLVREEVERCVSPYLKRHKCRDIEVVIDDETDPDLGARYCTVSFSPRRVARPCTIYTSSHKGCVSSLWCWTTAGSRCKHSPSCSRQDGLQC
jgi:hypothetical protein